MNFYVLSILWRDIKYPKIRRNRLRKPLWSYMQLSNKFLNVCGQKHQFDKNPKTVSKKSVCVTCHLSPVSCHLSPVTCDMSPVTCHLSPVTCHLSPVTCHLSLTPTTIATDSPPANYPTLHSQVICKDPKPNCRKKRNKLLHSSEEKNIFPIFDISDTLFDLRSLVHRVGSILGRDIQTDIATYSLNWSRDDSVKTSPD